MVVKMGVGFVSNFMDNTVYTAVREFRKLACKRYELMYCGMFSDSQYRRSSAECIILSKGVKV